MLTVHPILYELVFRVQIVEDGISIGLMTRGEHDYLKLLGCLFQAFSPVRSDIHACADYILRVSLLSEIYFQDDIWRLSFYIVYAVDQCLIHVKDGNLPLCQRFPRLRKLN